MIPHYTKIHNFFKLNDYSYNKEELFDVAYSDIKMSRKVLKNPK